MNDRTLAKHYGKLTERERAILSINAFGRKDENEAARLIDASPRVTLDAPDCGRLIMRVMNVIGWHCLKQAESAALWFMSAHYGDDERFGKILVSHQIIARSDGWKIFCDELGLDPVGALQIVAANHALFGMVEEIARQINPQLEDARVELRKQTDDADAEPMTAEGYAAEYRALLNVLAGKRKN